MRIARASCLVLAVILLHILPSFSQPCTLKGTFAIGTGGNYATLTDALAFLKTNGVGGPVVLELQAGYTSKGEKFPLTIDSIPCSSQTNNITIRPAANATNLTITDSANTALFVFSNARFVTIDGRPGGVGTTKQLSIINNYALYAVTFINGASFNNLQYLSLRGADKTIFFSTNTTASSSGNSNNTVSNCLINASMNGVYSAGTNNKKNTSNKVLDCDIKGSYGPAINLGQNSEGWRIAGNSIFSFNSKTVTGINIDDTTSAGFSIENNYIGGTAPGCGGTPFSISGNETGVFKGIALNVGNASFTSIQNNTIGNISFSPSEFNSAAFNGIYLSAGKFHCGDIKGNTIGSTVQTKNIQLKVPRGISDFTGICLNYDKVRGPDTAFVKNNKIGGVFITINNYLNNYYFKGILVNRQSKGFVDVSANTIGSATVANSIDCNTFPPETEITGIYVEALPAPVNAQSSISNNLIANILGNTNAIIAKYGTCYINNNTVRNLTAQTISNEWAEFGRGIVTYGLNPGSTINGNVLHSFFSYNTAGMPELTGIRCEGGGITIADNKISNFEVRSNKECCELPVTGISLSAGNLLVKNNMINLGTDTSGKAMTGNHRTVGIEVLSAGNLSLLNNSVYIAGTSKYLAACLFVIKVDSSLRVQNNIFFDARTNLDPNYYLSYAVRYGIIDPKKMVSNNNLYYVTGANAFIGGITTANGVNVTNYSDLISWRKGSGGDSNSIHYNPNFLKPEGKAGVWDLHLANPNPAEGQGIADVAVTTDIDGQLRAGISPADIGADADNFTYQDGDAPLLSHKDFLGQPVTSSYQYLVKITDNGAGVDTSGNNKPRMWFRKKYPSTGNWASAPGTLQSGNLNGGVWAFAPNFAAAGVPVSVGDSLEYYFVAQDKGILPNIGYSSIAGAQHSSVNAQVKAPATLKRLLIYGVFADTIYVGNGRQYTSLTNDGGFFEACKTYLFDSTHATSTVIITSDLQETAKFSFRNLNESGPAIVFTTNTPVVKVISMDVKPYAFGMLEIYGNNIVFDGSVNGSGRFLLMRSSYQDVAFTRNALYVNVLKRIEIKNCIFESNNNRSYSPSVAVIGDHGSGLVEGNLFRDMGAGYTMPLKALDVNCGALYTITVRSNDFTNFSGSGVTVTINGDDSSRANVDSNHFYFNTATTMPTDLKLRAIDVDGYSGLCSITGNYFGGTDRFCGGAAWTSAGNNTGFIAINIRTDRDKSVVTVQHNRIRNIQSLKLGLSGIYANGNNVFIGRNGGNIIGDAVNDTSLNLNFLMGIYAYMDNNSAQKNCIIENNQVYGIAAIEATGISVQADSAMVINNTIARIKYPLNSFQQYGRITAIKAILSKGKIAQNKMYNLVSGQGPCRGIDAMYPMGLEIARNKIYGLNCVYDGSTNPDITAIYLQDGNCNVVNNQISLGAQAPLESMKIRGIELKSSFSAKPSSFYYNSIFIAGKFYSSNYSSYGLLITDSTPVDAFKNNLIYSAREGEGGAGDPAIGITVPQNKKHGWPVGGADNNFYIVYDTMHITDFPSTLAMNMRNWRTVTGGDAASYIVPAKILLPNSLFKDVVNGDLNIAPNSPLSWYVNGRGVPIPGISADYDSSANIRSVNVTNGPTDIGADEFTATSTPPALIVTGNHVPGGADTLSANGRIMVVIKWENMGTLPTLGTARWYSGVWPKDTTNNNTVFAARFLSGYWDIPATGGSGYKYSITFHYDTAMLGRITDPSGMVLNKRDPALPGSWKELVPTIVDTVQQTITVSNQVSFSEFTATDSSATLAKSARLPDLQLTGESIDKTTVATADSVLVKFTVSNKGADTAAGSKVRIYLSTDDIASPGIDTLLLELALNKSIPVNGASDPVSVLTGIPCNIKAGSYKLLIVADAADAIKEQRENNNVRSFPIVITPGAVIPAIPVIAASPGTTICAPGKITLSTAAACAACTYTWNTGDNGNSLAVGASGTYVLSVKNSCGTVTASKTVTVNPVPALYVSSNTTTACGGSSLLLYALGADSYVWTGPGLNNKPGAAVSVPAVAGSNVYAVTGYANGCQASGTISIQTSASVAPAVQVAYDGCGTGTLNFKATATNGGNNPVYQWLVDGVTAGSGATFSLTTATMGTKVTCFLIADVACASPEITSITTTVNCSATPVPDIEGLESFRIMPNPSYGPVNIRLHLNQVKKVAFAIADNTGKILYRMPAVNWAGTINHRIDLQHVKPGLYYLSTTIGNKTFAEKIVIIR